MTLLRLRRAAHTAYSPKTSSPLGQHARFFKSSLLYLAYTPLDAIAPEKRPQLAFEITLRRCEQRHQIRVQPNPGAAADPAARLAQRV